MEYFDKCWMTEPTAVDLLRDDTVHDNMKFHTLPQAPTQYAKQGLVSSSRILGPTADVIGNWGVAVWWDCYVTSRFTPQFWWL